MICSFLNEEHVKMLGCVKVFVLATIIFSAFPAPKVHAVPDMVLLMTGASTVDSVRTIWYKPDGEVTSYEIGCSQGDAIPPSVIQTGDGPYTATCQNLLLPGDVYTMSVTSLHNGERSQPAIISLTALPNSPYLAELNSSVDFVSASWYKPAGIVTSYEIGCREGIALPRSVNQTGLGPFSASCVQLPTPGEVYVMNVASLSGVQRSHHAVISLRASPSPVTDLSEFGATSDSVSAIWTKPPGKVDSYHVICPDGSSTVEPENNDGSTHTVTCTGLTDPGGRYTIVVITSSSGKTSVAVNVTITLNTHVSETDAPSPAVKSSPALATTLTLTATTESITETVSTILPTTSDNDENPTQFSQLKLEHIIIAVLSVVLLVFACVAVFVLCRRIRRVTSDRRPETDDPGNDNHSYAEIDDVPPPPPPPINHVYEEPTMVHGTTGIIGDSGGMLAVQAL